MLISVQLIRTKIWKTYIILSIYVADLPLLFPYLNRFKINRSCVQPAMFFTFKDALSFSRVFVLTDLFHIVFAHACIGDVMRYFSIIGET